MMKRERRVYFPGKPSGRVSFQWTKQPAYQIRRAVAHAYPKAKHLEVSTASEDSIGRKLSAFNLELEREGITVPVENWYQSSKVFTRGGPYPDLMKVSALAAKTDPRLKKSGDLKYFVCLGKKWSLGSKFYEFLYHSALDQHPELAAQARRYNAFTDVFANPFASFACQAEALSNYLGERK